MVDGRTWWLLLVALGLALAWAIRSRCAVPRPPRPSHRAFPRAGRARTPQDGVACCAESAGAAPVETARAAVRPWAEVKRRRGAPKRLATAGYACPAPACPSFGITDERVHALIGYGHHGTTDHIRDLRCQACGGKFSARRGTALDRVKTPPARVGAVLGALAEGLDVAAAARVFGHSEATIAAWLARAGRHAGRLHARFFRELHLPHVQLDEIRTRLRPRVGTVWLWLAMDPLSKIIPVIQLGPRTQQAAHAVVHALRASLAPTCVPAVASDGRRLYSYALTAHFGRWARQGRARVWQGAPGLLYGQVQQRYRRRRLVHVRYRVPCGTAARLRTALQALGLSGHLHTAFVARRNLTVRQGVAALTRRTWATAQTAARLQSHLEWWRGYDHFVRPHRSVRVARPRPHPRGGGRLAQRYAQRAPAMAAGIVTHRWSIVELLSYPCPAAGS